MGDNLAYNVSWKDLDKIGVAPPATAETPRLAVVLDIAVNTHFHVNGYEGEYWVTEQGGPNFDGKGASMDAFFHAINHPESIAMI